MIDRAVLLGMQAATLATRAAVGLRSRLGARAPAPPADGPLRILMVAHYPASNAGTRCRLLEWVTPLETLGHEVEVVLPTTSPAMEAAYRSWDRAGRARYHRGVLASRRAAVARAGRAHAVLVHLSDIPHWEYGPPFVARALARRAGRVVLDLDDLPVVRGAEDVAPRVRALVAATDGLTLGNRFLRERFPERPAWQVPTCVDVDAWPTGGTGDGAPPVLGWIGTSGNLPPLERLAPVLARVQEETGARVRVVCDRAPVLPGVHVEFVPWTLANERRDVASFDVGLAPLADGPMQRCKCGLKALQAMACGLPVVADPVGVLADIVADGVTGYLPRSDADWGAALSRLARDGAHRRELGTAGRARAAADWSFERHLPTLVHALRGTPSTW